MSSAPLSSLLCHQVETLLRSLDDLQGSTGVQGNQGPAAIHQQVAEFQQPFQQLLQAVAQADLDPAMGQRLRTYQTEAHRRLRLLSVEAMKLRTAKQPMTLARSHAQLRDHLGQLQQFMQAIADEVCSS